MAGRRFIATRRALRQSVPALTLGLLACLVDAHSHRERFPAAAKARAAHRGGPKIVQPGRDPHMGVGGADAIGRIEANPAKVLDVGLRPGVSGLLWGDAVGAMKVATDIARRNFERSSRRDKNMGEVLADTAADRESLRRRGGSVRGIGIEGNF